MADEEQGFKAVIFGYDYTRQRAFVAELHGADGSPPHLANQVSFAWEQVPLLVEGISQKYLLMNPSIVIFEGLLRDGMPLEQAKAKAEVMARREREIGEV